jgi:hypothetical protein
MAGLDASHEARQQRRVARHQNEKPTDPSAPRSQSEIEELKKNEKVGNKSTGG